MVDIEFSIYIVKLYIISENHHNGITEALVYNIMQLYQPTRPLSSIALHMVAIIHSVNKVSSCFMAVLHGFLVT